MPRFPFFPGLPELSCIAIEACGVNTASSTMTSLTGGAANQWGNWTQLLASSAKKAIGLIVCVSAVTAAWDCRVQIGVGAIGSEAPKADFGFNFATTTSGGGAQYAFFLVNIPAGSRISARLLAAAGSTSQDVGCWLCEVD